MLLNSWKIYDPKEGDDDGLGTFYNGEGILEDLFSTYNYYKSPMLNQWYFNKERDNPFAFLCYIFAKGKESTLYNSLIISTYKIGKRKRVTIWLLLKFPGLP